MIFDNGIPGMGFPVRIQGTGTGINVFLQWCFVGTGNRNREHLWVWSPREPGCPAKKIDMSQRI